MKTTCVGLASLILIVLTVPAASAHHSASAMDFANTVEIEGEVQLIRVTNPHMKLILRVTDEQGTRDIEFEGHSRNNVYRSGWRTDTMKVGDTITAIIAPMRDGSDGGYVTAFRTASGEQIGFQ